LLGFGWPLVALPWDWTCSLVVLTMRINIVCITSIIIFADIFIRHVWNIRTCFPSTGNMF
jgi:hypothetical protein